MVETFPNGFHIWASYALVSAAIIGFAIGRVQVELTSLLILVSLLLLFEIFPLLDAAGEPVLETRDLLAGFANPALLSVMALLVLGNGLWRSGAMDRGLKWMMGYAGNHEKVVLVVCFTVIFLTSPFVSNTPVVVIFIPVFEAIARRYSIQPSVTMMPLSFIAILAGMTTLIGSSTNLLVSGAMSALGERPLGFFEFTLPGLVLATTGLFYVIFIMPRLLPLRISPMQRFISGKHRRFIAQFNLGADPKLVGAAPRFNILGINGTRLLLVQRGDHPFVPPFGNLILQEGDVLVIMATYQGLAEVHTRFPSLMFSTSGEEDMPEKGAERESWLSRDQSVAEAMIAPGSQFAGQNLEEIGFRTRYGCLVLGIERHARVSRHLTGSIIYEGDILVLQGSRDAIDRLREHRGVVVLDGSTQPLPEARDARMASIIFVCTILIASLGLLPISVTAIAGVSLMLVTRVLTLKQASRA
ncbi:SLC13 family permease, partial [Aestuariispira insulae]